MTVFDALPIEKRKQVKRKKQPGWCDPMLATLAREPFSDRDWLFETKLDGIRCLGLSKSRKVELFSRNRLRLDRAYPEIASALLDQGGRDFIVDGEIAAMKQGITSFSALQRRMQERVPVFYYLFDILYLDGYDLTGLELRYRKEILRQVFSFKDPLRFSEHREAKGEAYYREACRKGLEGVVAKRAASPYIHQRSADWLKFKCENEQEFVIAGYTGPAGARSGIGAIVVAVYRGGRLLCAGKVGTGFDTATLQMLRQKLAAIEVKTPPCAPESLPRAPVHWVRPQYVVQVAFTEWTAAGKLRHPRYLGLRTDKEAREVVRES